MSAPKMSLEPPPGGFRTLKQKKRREVKNMSIRSITSANLVSIFTLPAQFLIDFCRGLVVSHITLFKNDLRFSSSK